MGERVRKIPDLRWLFVVLIIVGLLITTIALGNNQPEMTTETLTDSLDIDNGDLKINWEQYHTTDIKLGETLTINKSGVYHLTGDLNDGSIIIKSSLAEIKLILDNVNITNSKGPAIECYDAEDLVIELIGENTITDGENYSDVQEADVTGAIYSKADLTFQGSGELTVNANYQDGIVGKDDVKFNSGNYTINSSDDAIRGKDSVYIVNGNINTNAGMDCIKTTNDIDAGKGFILIKEGNLNLSSKEGKGLKAVKTIMIQNGNTVISTYDDAIHSDNYIDIIDGNININAGDDAIHANHELIINGGNIHVAKAYEGLEAQIVTINNGDISLTTNDDGINAGGGADNSSLNRPGANTFDADENCVLSINGGNLYINSAGDGVDSNGWLYINGGNTIVDGPTNDGNGSLDSGMGIIMNGGEVIAVGSSGMAEAPSNASNIFSVNIYLESIQLANAKIEIKKLTGESIMEHTPSKQFTNLIFGSDKLQIGETYVLYMDSEEYERFTISDTTTIVGQSNNNLNRKQH